MSLNFVLPLLVLMIAYDLSIHIIYLLGFEDFFLKRKINYWPRWHWRGRKYQLFWATYWSIALILALIYILSLWV